MRFVAIQVHVLIDNVEIEFAKDAIENYLIAQILNKIDKVGNTEKMCPM